MSRTEKMALWVLESSLFRKWWAWCEQKLNPPPQTVEVTWNGITFCTNSGCVYYLRQSFLHSNLESISCVGCGNRNESELEVRLYTRKENIFSEVRVEYNYDPRLKQYLSTAVVRNEAVTKGDVYVIKTPLIRGRNKALMTAEATLAGLQCLRREAEGREVSPRTETVLSFDLPREEFLQECQLLEKTLKESSLALPAKKGWFRKLTR